MEIEFRPEFSGTLKISAIIIAEHGRVVFRRADTGVRASRGGAGRELALYYLSSSSAYVQYDEVGNRDIFNASTRHAAVEPQLLVP
ncbi:hypothetical protein EVAR_26608_1 [Eumeta japonica]|uniref:Uncharacterized protein n=1 Tax=Eumeta variegata TaxID=151549 RepID=A0A4C1XLA0_EUMVA|nr:hypothetical protein EVAR_26608_1 [Eumeta japonica]